MKRNSLWLALIIVLAAVLRLYSAYGIPATGDESVSIMQAAGKAHELGYFFKEHGLKVIPSADLKWFLEYSGDHGLPDVAKSMEQTGMHPPLYYFFLHGVLKYFGNDAFLLRYASILFSLGSVWAVYLIGKELKDETLGLMAALLFAVSSYGIKFAFMIRPYPMVMFIALLSAWLAIKWSGKDSFEFSSRYYWAILALSVAGFYSIYHFVFCLVFLWSFLFLKALRSKKDMLVIISIPIVTGVCCLPWIPSLLHQMQAVNQGNYYFNSLSNPIAGMGQLLTLNFTKFLPFKIVPSIFVLLFLLILGFAGLRSFLSSKPGRFMVCALTLSVLANTGIDLIMKTNTICVNKLAFFLSPVSLIFLAAGSLYIKDRLNWKRSPFLILWALAAIHSFFAFPNDLAVDGPYGKSLLEELDRDISPADKKLAVINEPRRRYVLSFVHGIQSPPDFVFTALSTYRDRLGSIERLDEYNSITLICISEENNNEIMPQIAPASKYLEKVGYHIKLEHPCTLGYLIVLEKDVQSEAAPSGSADSVSQRPDSRSRICSFAQN